MELGVFSLPAGLELLIPTMLGFGPLRCLIPLPPLVLLLLEGPQPGDDLDLSFIWSEYVLSPSLWVCSWFLKL